MLNEGNKVLNFHNGRETARIPFLVRIRSYSDPYFPAFEPNTESYGVLFVFSPNAWKCELE